MSTTKKSKYELLAKLRELDHSKKRVQAHGSIEQTGIETGKDLVFGALIGGGVSALIDKPVASFIGGLVLTGAGHYMGSTSTSAFGLGMMTSASFQTVSGLINKNTSAQKPVNGIGERFQALRTGVMQMLKSKKTTSKEESTDGVGEVQYFVYPNKELEGTDQELDLSALDNIEKQLAESGEDFENSKSVGMLSSESDIGELDDISEGNY
jgi:hypothetical protein